MAMGRNCEAGSQIEKSVSIDIPDIRAGSFFPKNRKIGADIGNVPILVFLE